MPRFEIVAQEKLVHRTFYTVDDPKVTTPEQAVELCRSGKVVYSCTEIVEGGEEWLGTESAVLAATPAPGPKQVAVELASLLDTGSLMSLGTLNDFHAVKASSSKNRICIAAFDVPVTENEILKKPELDGTIHLTDKNGVCLETRRIGDAGWQDWADTWDMTPDDFADDED